MRRFWVLALVFSGAIVALIGPGAQAENSPIGRDCSFLSLPVASVDADFIWISAATLEADTAGNLSVDPSEKALLIVASESYDQGDQAGHVTLHATISTPGVGSFSTSGAGTDFVILELPLNGSVANRVYTISWSATFDNGGHSCPSAITPSNTSPHPFVVTVK